MNGIEYGGLILDILVGVGALLVGLGIFVLGLAAAKTLARLRQTLDEVDRQLKTIGPPVASTLTQVDGVTKSLGETADTLSRTADLAKTAVTPAIVNVGATMSGVTAGLRRLVTGKDAKS